ncbi:MAG: T9SS type A sorting domain-containing protein [Candidatus Aegiribacteria sp.]|nr:T9SS type A sorting domain-containing protein [Candidatus Aegiribacteria sp.]
MIFVLTIPLFAHSGDPALYEFTGSCDVSENSTASLIYPPVSPDQKAPTFTISHTENGTEVTINVASNEDLFSGWVAGKDIWSNSNWDYWWLNTRIATDAENNIYAAVKLYEYSNPSINYDMFVLENNGDISESFLDWNGPESNPLIVNNPDPNIYIEQPTLDREGAVDSDNNTYLIYTNGGSNIIFTKLDSDGTLLINGLNIVVGANAWTNEARVDIAPDGRIYVVWSESLHDIQYVYSDDGGDSGSWSIPASICYNASDQLCKPQISCDTNGNVHIIWQHSSKLAYMKLLPDCTVSIDESFLTSGGVWSPMMDIDEQNNLHIVWGTGTQGSNSVYYTEINGNLDGGGASMTDDELTIVQETPFIVSTDVRYPKCIVDSYMNVHAVYEQGEYGRHHPKAMNYIKMNGVPLLRIVCPDESVLFVEMTGSGADWEGTFTPPVNGIYSAGVSGSDADGNTGIDTYQFEFPNTGIESESGLPVSGVSCSPNPFRESISFSYDLSETGYVNVTIYDMTGRLIETLLNEEQQTGLHSINWKASDMNPGMYLCRISSGAESETLRCVIVAD